jgi:cytochrome c553
MDNLKILDAYPKTLEDFRIRTLAGGAVTAISIILIAVLFVVEFNFYLSTEILPELTVDLNRNVKLEISLNVTFPKLACQLLSLDALDVSGEQHFDISHEVFKIRLGLDGNVIAVELLNVTATAAASASANKSSELQVPMCGSCYGAETNSEQCCNTCDDVKTAYRRKGWTLLDYSTVAQCKSEVAKEVPLEGCRIEGRMLVNKISGNFHITPGRSYEQSHSHVHDFSQFTNREFDSTHHIHHLAFGPRYPDMANPLDGLEVVSSSSNLMHTYYVKLVPTTYDGLQTDPIHSNQFSMTKHQQTINIGPMAGGLPGLFVNYEFSPIHVKLTETPRSLGHFLTALCSIVGGVVTVAGLVDAAIFNTSRIVQRKMELGKFT